MLLDRWMDDSIISSSDMLETEYSGFTGSEVRQSIISHGIGYVGQTACIVIAELMPYICFKTNPIYKSKYEYIFCSLSAF